MPATDPRPSPALVYGPDVVSTPDAARASGLSYRQINYWIAVHAIKPAFGTGGSGRPYGFTRRQVEILVQIGKTYRLFERGLFGAMQTDFVRKVWDALTETGEFHFSEGPLVLRLPWPDDVFEPSA